MNPNLGNVLSYKKQMRIKYFKKLSKVNLEIKYFSALKCQPETLSKT